MGDAFEVARRQIPVVGSNGLNLARQYTHLRTGARVSRPTQIYVNINERCNLRCKYCDNWKSDGSDELDGDTWRRALDELLTWVRRPKVNISGGEPFMRRDLLELLELCVRKGALTGVVTNGYYLSPSTAPKVAALGLSNINISIDSLEPDVFNDIRAAGRPTHAAVVHDAILRIAHEIRRAGSGTKVFLKTVVCGTNLDSLVPLVRFVERERLAGIMFQPLEAVYGREVDYGDEWHLNTDLWPETPDGIAEVAAELRAMKAAGSPILNPDAHLDSWDAYFRDPIGGVGGQLARHAGESDGDVGSSRCTIGHSHLYIDSNGDIRLCWDYEPIGNIVTDSVRTSWNGDTAEAVRARIGVCAEPCTKTSLLDRGLRDTVATYVRLVGPSRD